MKIKKNTEDIIYGQAIPEIQIKTKGKNLPDPLSPEGREKAKFFRDRILSGNLSVEAVPEQYKKVVKNYLDSYEIEKAARQRKGYGELNNAMFAATGGLPGLLGHFGSKIVDETVNKTTGKNSWGQAIYSGNNPVWSFLSELTNPGNILGGIGATRDVTKRWNASSLQKNGSYIEKLANKSKILQKQRAIDKAVSDIYASNPIFNHTSKSLAEPGMPYSYYSDYYKHLDGPHKVYLPKSKTVNLLPKAKEVASLPESSRTLYLPESNRPLGLLSEPTASYRRSLDATAEGSTYANNIPKKYIDYVGPEAIYMSPRVITKLPYRKDGKNWEKKLTTLFNDVKINIADVNQASNIYSFDDLNKVIQKTYDDSYNIIRHFAKGRDVYYSKRTFNDLVRFLTLDKLKRHHPDIPIETRANQFYREFPERSIFTHDRDDLYKLNDVLKEIQLRTKNNNYNQDLLKDIFNNKRKSLRQVRALKKMLEQYKNSNKNSTSNISEVSLDPYPNIKDLLTKSPQYTEDAKELINNASKRLNNSEDIEKDVITNLLLQRHRFIRGASLKNNDDELIKKVFTTIPDKEYGGRSDFNPMVFDPHVYDAMYTSNSMGTGIGYSYPKAGEHSRVAVIGKTINDLDLSGEVSTWWDKNRLFEEQPKYKYEVKPGEFYLHKAESTNLGGTTVVPNRSKISNFIKQFPGSETLIQNMLDRKWDVSTKTLRGVDNPLLQNVSKRNDPFNHYLFIGPKGKSIPGYKILELYNPKKERIDIDADQIVTRSHFGNYSKGFSKGMKHGGIISNINNFIKK